MAQMEKKDYKFPDEQDETKGKPLETEAAADEVEYVIEDDTPAEDKNAKPLPVEVKEELENDNLMEYSNKVKMRLEQMKKAWHDERRVKEAAEREREEAIRFAQQVAQENKKLKSTLSEGEKQYVSTMQSAAETEMEMAKRAYRDAYDSGDSDRIVEAQQQLTEASLKQDRAKNFKPSLQIQEDDVQTYQQATQTQESPKIDPLTSKWLERNTWYGPDEEMTALALGTHAKLEKEFGKGYIGTEEYFKRIDNTMRKRFPENFSEETEVETQAGGDKPSQRTEAKSAPVVAPATRSTASKRIVLKASQVALAKKLGLTPEQYAREMQKLEA
jgi:hypothetical protein|tara:strand:- start:464 stop:1453 length:990 start_codon:yes stop_codon:yes gene_type:complete